VEDVRSGARPPGPFDHLGDRDVLRAARSGFQEPVVDVPVRAGSLVNGAGIFRMDDHQRIEGLDLGHVRFHLVRLEVREFIHPGVQQEAFEPEDAVVVKGPQILLIPRNRAAPEPHVHERVVACEQPLVLQGRGVHGGGNRIQRHVHDGRDAARGGRPSGAGETFPLCPTWFVDVHVRVHQAGNQGFVVGQVHHLGGFEVCAQRFDRHDLPVPDGHLARGKMVAAGHLAAADHEVETRGAARSPGVARGNPGIPGGSLHRCVRGFVPGAVSRDVGADEFADALRVVGPFGQAKLLGPRGFHLGLPVFGRGPLGILPCGRVRGVLGLRRGCRVLDLRTHRSHRFLRVVLGRDRPVARGLRRRILGRGLP
jgi:hypothetical protein